jgi:sortase B
MLMVVKPYLPKDAPADHHAPIVTVPEAPPADNPELPDNPVDFAALTAEFPEAVAWIRIPDTAIDFVVMQSGENTKEDFYLDHNEEGEKSRSGAIYMQKYNMANFSDPNTILYGHNMSGGKMFGGIHKFKKADYFNEHEYLYIYMPGHVLTYRIYSLFDFDDRHLLWAYDFTTAEGRQKFIDKTLNPRTYNRLVRQGVTPTPDDRFITLSTCQNTGDGRLLLVAVLVEDMKTK